MSYLTISTSLSKNKSVHCKTSHFLQYMDCYSILDAAETAVCVCVCDSCSSLHLACVWLQGVEEGSPGFTHTHTCRSRWVVLPVFNLTLVRRASKQIQDFCSPLLRTHTTQTCMQAHTHTRTDIDSHTHSYAFAGLVSSHAEVTARSVCLTLR